MIAFALIALDRLFYPFEVSWMESSMYEMMLRRLHERSIYAAPTLAYTPCLYPPFYFDVSALVARALGLATSVTFLPLRLVSVCASVSTFVLLIFLVRRKGLTTRSAVGLASIHLASYGRFECWHDNSRVDAFYGLLLFIAAAFLLEGRRLRSAFAAGAFSGAAVLTKQPAVVLMGLAAAGPLLARRELARVSVAAATAAVVISGYLVSTGELRNPYFYHYLLAIPASHPLEARLFARGLFFLPVTVPFLCAAAWPALRARGEGWRAVLRSRPWSSTFASWLAATVVLHAKHGASINFFLPLLPVAVLAAVEGMGVLATSPTRIGRWLPLLPAAQLVFLVYDPRPFVPTARDVATAQALVDRLREIDGPVFFPAFPSYAALAGKPWFAQEVALADLAQLHPDLVRGSLTRSIEDGAFGGLIIAPGTSFADSAAWRGFRREPLPEPASPFLRELHRHHSSAGILIPKQRAAARLQ